MKMQIIFIAVIVFACTATPDDKLAEIKQAQQIVQSEPILNPEGKTIESRFATPTGFTRKPCSEGSFAVYVRSLPLKPDGDPVYFYNGEEKRSNKHAAIIDMTVGDRDLQQCADAIMRVRAEYFFYRKEYDSISFHFVNGFDATYKKWAEGQRIGVNGNKTYWYGNLESDYSYDTFMKYLIMVYSYAGTASFEKELKPKPLKKMEVGDVLIQGGSPGHAMLVVDVAENEKGEKAFMLAQSYMPAQSFHIVRNGWSSGISPWYLISDVVNIIETPSWSFNPGDLHGF